MANATSVVVVKDGREQFQGIFNKVFEVRATINVDDIADQSGDNDTIAVPGVALGDMVLGISLGVDVAGLTVTGWVSAADVVTIRFQNESGGSVNLAETTIKVLVGRPGW
jgi:ribosomal protein L18E